MLQVVLQVEFDKEFLLGKGLIKLARLPSPSANRIHLRFSCNCSLASRLPRRATATTILPSDRPAHLSSVPHFSFIFLLIWLAERVLQLIAPLFSYHFRPSISLSCLSITAARQRTPHSPYLPLRRPSVPSLWVVYPQETILCLLSDRPQTKIGASTLLLLNLSHDSPVQKILAQDLAENEPVRTLRRGGAMKKLQIQSKFR